MTVTDLAVWTEPDDSADAAFWGARPILAHIRAVARARQAGPWATLGCVLVRAVCATEPTVQLPALIGGNASLNMFVALVGPSGGGKGTADAAARAAVEFLDTGTGDLVETDMLPLGSGEGLRSAYRQAVKASKENPNPEPMTVRTRALFLATEVDTAAAIASRSGSTLMPELRKLFSGEAIGAQNASAERRVIVPEHSYRAGLIVGLQPARGAAILHDADGGTPQRFLMLPTSDPDAPDEQPADPGPESVQFIQDRGSVMTVPEHVRLAVRRHRLAVHREDPDVDPLDGHRMLLQLKVAAALAILDVRLGEVTDDDWKLAAWVMSVSDRTRSKVERTLWEGSRKLNVARALDQADRDETVSERKLQRARESVLRWLAKGDRARHELQKNLKADIRDYLETALAELEDEGRIRRNPDSRRYTCTTGTPPKNVALAGEMDRVPKVHGVPGQSRNRSRNRTHHRQG